MIKKETQNKVANAELDALEASRELALKSCPHIIIVPTFGGMRSFSNMKQEDTYEAIRKMYKSLEDGKAELQWEENLEDRKDDTRKDSE